MGKIYNKRNYDFIFKPPPSQPVCYDSLLKLNFSSEFFIDTELRILLSDAYRKQEINLLGLIKKHRLRSILLRKIEKGELGVLDPDTLGRTLSAFGYLFNTEKNSGYFKLDIEKIQALSRDRDQQVLELDQGNITDIEYSRTIQRKKTRDYTNFIKINVPVCFVCSLPLFQQYKLKKHLNTAHGREYSFPSRPNHSTATQLFQLKFLVINENDKIYTCLNIKSVSDRQVTINQVQLICGIEEIVQLEGKWPIKMDAKTDINVPCHYYYFKEPNLKYSFIIYGEHDLEIIEQHHFSLPLPLSDPISIRDQCTRAERYESGLVCKKTKPLPKYESDPGILAFVSDTYDFCNHDSNSLSKKLYSKYRALVQFRANNYVLNQKNYVPILQILTEMEDLFIIEQLSSFSIKDKIVVERCRGFGINIENVPDIPDSITDGDSIILFREGNKKFEYVINKFLDGYILFGCLPMCKRGKADPQSERLRKNVIFQKPFDIKFRKDRTCIRMEKDALANIDESIIRHVLFPNHTPHAVRKHEVKDWFSPTVVTNSEQKQAVINILNGTAYPAPYIIFGPPGTGKTTTLVEAITQIWALQPTARVLVTANSNYAVDEIGCRLLKYIDDEDIYRFYTRSAVKKIDGIHDDLLRVSNLNTGFHRKEITKSILSSYRIILTTLINAGKLRLNGFEKNFFDYIFIDECGSSTEASSIIPISGLMLLDKSSQTKVIIAGDPKQLGPTISCPFADMLGLNKSLLERLMDLEIYKPNRESQKYNEMVITKLLQNYRSHGDILKVANDLYYAGELIPKASSELVNWALDWKFLPNKRVPVIFHPVRGQIMNGVNSFSLYNKQEVKMVMYYVNEIVQNGINGHGIPLTEIGIISPYRQQCEKIELACKQEGWREIEVGSVEQFQGREKMCIILSTVRSFTKTVGFLNDPKRLNVSITRAKGLMIVIGNPETLQLDPQWYELVKFCKESGAFTTDPFILSNPSNVSTNYNQVLRNHFNEKLSNVGNHLINSINLAGLNLNQDDLNKVLVNHNGSK